VLSCECDVVGDDEETKKQKQKQLIDAAFKLTMKTENAEKNESNGSVDGMDDSGDGWCCPVMLTRPEHLRPKPSTLKAKAITPCITVHRLKIKDEVVNSCVTWTIFSSPLTLRCGMTNVTDNVIPVESRSYWLTFSGSELKVNFVCLV